MSKEIQLKLTTNEAYMLTQLLRKDKHKDLKSRIHALIGKSKLENKDK